MSWLGLLLIGVGLTDLVFSLLETTGRPARIVPECIGAAASVIMALLADLTTGRDRDDHPRTLARQGLRGAAAQGRPAARPDGARVHRRHGARRAAHCREHRGGREGTAPLPGAAGRPRPCRPRAGHPRADRVLP